MGRNYAGVDGLAGACTFRHPRATPEQVVSVFLAGLLGERLISPHTDIEVANTDAQELRSFRTAWISTRLWRRRGCAFTTCGPKWPDWQKSLISTDRSMLARSMRGPDATACVDEMRSLRLMYHRTDERNAVRIAREGSGSTDSQAGSGCW